MYLKSMFQNDVLPHSQWYEQQTVCPQSRACWPSACKQQTSLDALHSILSIDSTLLTQDSTELADCIDSTGFQFHVIQVIVKKFKVTSVCFVKYGTTLACKVDFKFANLLI